MMIYLHPVFEIFHKLGYTCTIPFMEAGRIWESPLLLPHLIGILGIWLLFRQDSFAGVWKVQTDYKGSERFRWATSRTPAPTFCAWRTKPAAQKPAALEIHIIRTCFALRRLAWHGGPDRNGFSVSVKIINSPIISPSL